MADQTPIMPHAANEAPRNSDFATYFSLHLLPSMAAYIVAERDLEDVQGAFDPAYLAWEQDADEARERLTSVLFYLCEERTLVTTDRPLKRMALLVKELIWAEDVKVFRTLHREMRDTFLTHFQVRGFGPDAHQANAMLIQAFHLVDALVELPIFERWTDEELADFQKPASDDWSNLGL